MKKAISLLLVVTIFCSLLAINVDAAAMSYSDSKIISIKQDFTLNADEFNVDLIVDQSKILCFDGGNRNFSSDFDSVRVLSPATASYIEYSEDPEGFAAVFTDEEFKGADIYVDYTINFESEDVFGELDYEIVISGFSAPLDTGLDLGALLGGSDVSLPVPQDVVTSGSFSTFPSINYEKTNVLEKPVKTLYYDNERFDPTGTKLFITLNNNKTGTLTYAKDNANLFSFAPTSKENLSIHDNQVATLLLGHAVNYTPITVEHKWSAGPVSITTDKYSENKPGYHAIVCEGCGETHDAQPHTPKDEEWTYNNDQTFVANGTESNVCKDCGTVLTRDTFGTADFNTVFADMHFIKVIFEYINLLLRFISAAIGR